ncbi:hypothetical protein [Aliidiomarina celeris]|uniref:hypothetical protein n=1 Tax=Aliidiomarina celeris TaxID=2249428 RepID=UPI000DEA5D08|nr:hypothetical protein [Aliidiomarina celeris]
MSKFHSLAVELGSSAVKSPLVKAVSFFSFSDPANVVLENITFKDALFVKRHLKLPELDALLSAAQRRHALVMDRNGEVLGIVNKHSLYNGKTVRLAKELGVAHNELEAEQLMIPLARLPSVSKKALEQAKIGDIALTLQRCNSDFIGVTENDEWVGFIAALTIAEKTGESIHISLIGQSFAEIVHAVRHPEALE